MIQVSTSVGEASKQNMISLSGALTDGTEWSRKFTDEYAWWHAQPDHPELLIPHKGKDHEDRRT